MDVYHRHRQLCPSNCLASKEDKVQKLIADLGNKKYYVIHYRNFQQCIQNGLVLKKIHRGVQFLQKPWLNNYNDLNTLHTNKSEKDFFKLMNNSVYGKTMELSLLVHGKLRIARRLDEKHIVPKL